MINDLDNIDSIIALQATVFWMGLMDLLIISPTSKAHKNEKGHLSLDFGVQIHYQLVSFEFCLTLSIVYRNDLLCTPSHLLSALLCPDMPLAVVPLVSDDQSWTCALSPFLKSFLRLHFNSF